MQTYANPNCAIVLPSALLALVTLQSMMKLLATAHI